MVSQTTALDLEYHVLDLFETKDAAVLIVCCFGAAAWAADSLDDVVDLEIRGEVDVKVRVVAMPDDGADMEALRKTRAGGS